MSQAHGMLAVLLGMLPAIAAGESTLPPGAILLYTFDRDTLVESGGEWYAADLSGRGAHGKVEKRQAGDGIAGGCLRFSEGTIVRVSDDSAVREARAQTIAVWFRAAKYEAANYLISSEDWGGNKTRGFVLRLDREGRPEFTVGQGIWKSVLGDPLEAGRWHHLAATCDPGRIELWVNGRKSAVLDLTGAFERSTRGLTIGRGNYDEKRGFSGDIDEVVIFDRVLAGPEISALHDLGKGGEPLAAPDESLAAALRPEDGVHLGEGERAVLRAGRGGTLVLVSLGPKGFLLRIGKEFPLGEGREIPPPPGVKDVVDLDAVCGDDGSIHLFALAFSRQAANGSESSVHHSLLDVSGAVRGAWWNVGQRLGLEDVSRLPLAAPQRGGALLFHVAGGEGDGAALVTAAIARGAARQIDRVKRVDDDGVLDLEIGKIAGASGRDLWMLVDLDDGLLRWVEPRQRKRALCMELPRPAGGSVLDHDHQVLITRKGEAFIAVIEPPGKDAGGKESESANCIVARGKPGFAAASRRPLPAKISAHLPNRLIESPGGRVYLLAAAAVGRGISGDQRFTLGLWDLSGPEPRRLKAELRTGVLESLSAAFSDERTLGVAFASHGEVRGATLKLQEP